METTKELTCPFHIAIWPLWWHQWCLSDGDSDNSNKEGAGEVKPQVLTEAVWVGEPELAGQEGLGSVAGESQR